MHDPTRVALAAVALGLGVLWAGSPALAQFADGLDTQIGGKSPTNTAQAADDNGVSVVETPLGGTPPAETPSPAAANAADGVDASATETSAGEASSADAAVVGDDASVPAAEIMAVEASSDGAAAEASAEEPQSLDKPSPIAARMAAWVTTSGDNGGRPFVIVDKAAADVFAFDADGQLEGGTPALLGLAPGDDSAEGIGDRNLYAIPPDERTTPAGRFLAGFGAARGHRKILWVDYATAISLHPVVTTNPKERRLERLRSPAPEDRRITYGCINVPPSFYRNVVLKAFAGGGGVVYILPDTRPLAEVFPAFALQAQAGPASTDGVGDQASQGATESAPAAPSANDATEDASEHHSPEPPVGPDLVNTAGADARPW
jgi:hypothetical protein